MNDALTKFPDMTGKKSGNYRLPGEDDHSYSFGYYREPDADVLARGDWPAPKGEADTVEWQAFAKAFHAQNSFYPQDESDLGVWKIVKETLDRLRASILPPAPESAKVEAWQVSDCHTLTSGSNRPRHTWK